MEFLKIVQLIVNDIKGIVYQLTSNIKGIIIVLILTRLLYLEKDAALMLLEILGGTAVLINTPELDIIDHD